MKKTLLIFALILLTSCSSDDNAESTPLVVNLNPPEWIIGTWFSQDVGDNDYGWKFTDNNAIWIVENNNEFDIKEIATLMLNGYDELINQDQIIEEIITDNSYSVRLTFYDTRPDVVTDFTYEFIKVSETEIQWVTAPTFDKTLNMIKQ